MLMSPVKPDSLVVQNDQRGMQSLLRMLVPLPSLRAAQALLAERQRILCCTGFPVDGHPETDGPAGAVVIAHAMSGLGREVAVVSWADTLDAMGSSLGQLACVAIPCGKRPSKLKGAAVTIEVCGRTADGSYLNMRGIDVRNEAPWFEDAVGTHALVSIGDGGNEYGMGSAPAAWFEGRSVERPISTCDVLVLGQVSNWGALAVVAALSAETGRDLLPDPESYERLLHSLVDGGAVDGVAHSPQPTEDGFPVGSGAAVLRNLRDWVSAAASP